MRNLTLLSLAAAAVLFTACGEDAKKAAADATAKATETVKETANSAADATKEAASNAVEATKQAASDAATAAAQKATDAAEALKERAAATTEAAKEKAAEAVDATKEAASNAVEATKKAASDAAAAVAAPAAAADNAAGKALFAKCAGCHGADGKTKALGKSAVIAGEPAADIEKKLKEYKAGTRNVAGMGMLMKGQVASLSDEDIKALAEYISKL